MLFYELACHPEVFTREYLLKNNLAIKQIFKNITEKGSVANLNEGEWKDIVIKKIASLDNDKLKEGKLKKQLQNIFKVLQVRNKIIYHHKINNETDWLRIIYANEIDFSAILNTLTTHDTYEAEDLLESELWDNLTRTSSEYAIQDEEYIKFEIEPILHNARQIDLIDPYFDITKQRYIVPFKIILEALSNKTINKEVILSIHIKNQNNNLPDVLERTKYLKSWQDMFASNKNFNIQCTLYVWRETDKDKMHDRYIIRDESFCVVLPSGIDERRQNRTVWSDIGYHNIDGVLNDFRDESSPFKLVAKVNYNDILTLQQGNLKSIKNRKNAEIEENIHFKSGLNIKKRTRYAEKNRNAIT